MEAAERASDDVGASAAAQVESASIKSKCLSRPELFKRHLRTWDNLISHLKAENHREKIVLFIEPPRPGDLGSVLRSSVMHGIKWVVVLGEYTKVPILDALRAAQLGRELAGSEVYLTPVAAADLTREEALAQLRSLGVHLARIAHGASAIPVWDSNLCVSQQAWVFMGENDVTELEMTTTFGHSLDVPRVDSVRLNMPAVFEAIAYENHRQTHQKIRMQRSSMCAAEISSANTASQDTDSRFKNSSCFPSHPSCRCLRIAMWDEFLASSKDRLNVGSTLVLSGSQHAGNLGSALQSAAAHFIRTVIVLGCLAPDFVEKAIKIAQLDCSGVSEVMLVCARTELQPAKALTDLRALGFRLVGFTECTEGVPVWDTDMTHPRSALIFGKETGGIPDDADALMDVSSTIPQLSSHGTLNVSAAIEAVLFERHRQLHACRAQVLEKEPGHKHRRI